MGYVRLYQAVNWTLLSSVKIAALADTVLKMDSPALTNFEVLYLNLAFTALWAY